MNNEDGRIPGKYTYSHGFIGPKTDYMTVKNTRFHNFDFGDAAALGSCSHCFHPASGNNGCWQYTTSNLTFTNTPRRIKYDEPHREMILDLDGSLTGLGENSWAVSGRPHLGGAPHLYQPEC